MTSQMWLTISMCHHRQQCRSAVEAAEAGEGHAVAEEVVEVEGAGGAEEAARQPPGTLLCQDTLAGQIQLRIMCYYHFLLLLFALFHASVKYFNFTLYFVLDFII